MKIIYPSVELLIQTAGIEGIYKQIELAGRTCYKSEDRITESSAKMFVERMVASRHTAMLEHGTVYLALPMESKFPIMANGLGKYIKNPYSKGFRVCTVNGQKCAAVTTNYRVLVENGWLDDLQYLCVPTKYHDRRVTVHFVCDRAVANEFVRHRVFSFAQESTRYCNYSKNKFGKELAFIAPSWLRNEGGGLEDTNSQIFMESCKLAEKNYMSMLELGGAKPQDARAVLPLSLKTELVMTGFEDDWRHFFDLRYRGSTGAPHPDALRIAAMAHNLILEKLGKDL